MIPACVWKQNSLSLFRSLSLSAQNSFRTDGNRFFFTTLCEDTVQSNQVWGVLEAKSRHRVAGVRGANKGCVCLLCTPWQIKEQGPHPICRCTDAIIVTRWRYISIGVFFFRKTKTMTLNEHKCLTEILPF